MKTIAIVCPICGAVAGHLTINAEKILLETDRYQNGHKNKFEFVVERAITLKEYLPVCRGCRAQCEIREV